MKQNGKNIASRVAQLVAPTVEALGCTLWDVEYLREGTDWFLRITIDREGGVDTDDCERVHRAIDPLIDEADPIEDSYYLEVSSPGLERELRTDAHLAASLGVTVTARLYAPLDGAKAFTGTLSAYDADTFTLSAAGEERVLPRTAVAQLKTVYDFDEK